MRKLGVGQRRGAVRYLPHEEGTWQAGPVRTKVVSASLILVLIDGVGHSSMSLALELRRSSPVQTSRAAPWPNAAQPSGCLSRTSLPAASAPTVLLPCKHPGFVALYAGYLPASAQPSTTTCDPLPLGKQPPTGCRLTNHFRPALRPPPRRHLLAALPATCPSLEHLELGDCPGLTATQLAELLAAPPPAWAGAGGRQLPFSHSSGGAAAPAAASLPLLRYLVLHGAPQLTEGELREVRGGAGRGSPGT